MEIHFNTKAYLDSKKMGGAENTSALPQEQQTLDNKASLVHQWTFKNDGMHFRDEDWNRLKKIGTYYCVVSLLFGTNDPQRRVTPMRRRSEPLALVSGSTMSREFTIYINIWQDSTACSPSQKSHL